MSSQVLVPLDRLASRVRSGKSTVTSWATGIPVLWLTATGARSGSPRTVPLLGIPIEGDLALLGTSFGQRSTPAWVHNLEANPEAVVAYRRTVVRVRAMRAEPAQTKQVWELASEIYPGYANYAGRAPHRHIRVFLLETADDGDRD